MKIGYLDGSYPNVRCIIKKTDNSYSVLLKKKTEESRFTHLKNRVINHIRYKLGIKEKIWNKSSFFKASDFKNAKDFDLFHVFNYVVLTKRPWVTTFESETPVTDALIGRQWEIDKPYRFDRFSVKLLKRCAMDNCKGLIAISSSAYEIEKELIERSPLKAETKKKLDDKLFLVHPPQELICTKEEIDIKFDDVKEPTFIMIGHDFFRKGGKQVVEALSILYEKGLRFKLIIVSKLYYGDHASLSDKNDMLRLKDRISALPFIEYYETLENEKVLQLAKKAHVGLLPSLAETYGYSVLELQACGCACVTTNIRALGEINNKERGWVVDIKPNKFGESIYGNSTAEHKKQTQELLFSGLLDVFSDIVTNPSLIKQKAISSFDYVKENHNPKDYGEQIRSIYSR